MSVRLMSKVFEADLQDVVILAKNGKPTKVSAAALNSCLLALADHANDEGRGAYPSLSRLERKSSWQRINYS